MSAPTIELGDFVRSYDFPGMREDCYVEGVVTAIDPRRVDVLLAGYITIHVTRDVHEGVEQQPGGRLIIDAPLGVSTLTRKPAVVLLAKAQR